MDTPPIRCVDALQRGAMTRRLHRRSIVKGQITLPAVPGMIDAYLSMCESLLATVGRPFTPEQPAHVKSVLQGRLAEAYTRRFRARTRTQCCTTIFMSQELGTAACGLPLQLDELPREQCPIEMRGSSTRNPGGSAWPNSSCPASCR